MDDKNTGDFGWIDELVRDVRGDVSIYQLVSPENEVREKDRFENHLRDQLARQIPSDEQKVREAVSEISMDEITASELESLDLREPDFRYESPDNYDMHRNKIQEARKTLESTETSDQIKNLYIATLEECEALIDIAENLGDPETVQEASQEIYGRPSDEALEWAEETLREIEVSCKGEEKFSPAEMKSTLEAAVEELGMEDWTVVYTNKGVVSVNGANREIRVPEKDRMYTENEIARLPIHEVGTHALRNANGYHQDFEILGAGAARYHSTGEGLALFMEEETGLSNEQLKRKYAGRALAIQSVLDGEEFTDTYKMAREHDFSHERAWNIATRAHRAGGFIKDHIYAEGLQEVSDYVEEEGSIDDLLIGKISSEYSGLADEGLAARYSPADLVREIDGIVPDHVDTADIDTNGLDEHVSSPA